MNNVYLVTIMGNLLFIIGMYSLISLYFYVKYLISFKSRSKVDIAIYYLQKKPESGVIVILFVLSMLFLAYKIEEIIMSNIFFIVYYFLYFFWFGFEDIKLSFDINNNKIFSYFQGKNVFYIHKSLIQIILFNNIQEVSRKEIIKTKGLRIYSFFILIFLWGDIDRMWF